MLTRYIPGAMSRTRYEIPPDEGTCYGEIPSFQGVYANADALEDCRDEPEGWLLLRIARNRPVPSVDGIQIRVREPVWYPSSAPHPGRRSRQADSVCAHRRAQARGGGVRAVDGAGASRAAGGQAEAEAEPGGGG